MSHLTKQVEHVRRAIAYALWKAADDGRDPLTLMGDSAWISDVSGRFLALEVTEGRIPDAPLPPKAVPTSRSTYARQMCDGGES